MLTGGTFVVAVFNLDPHALERKNGFSPQITGSLQGG